MSGSLNRSRFHSKNSAHLFILLVDDQRELPVFFSLFWFQATPDNCCKGAPDARLPMGMGTRNVATRKLPRKTDAQFCRASLR